MAIGKIDSLLSLKPENFSINHYEGYANMPSLLYTERNGAIDGEINNLLAQQVFRVFKQYGDSATLYISDNTPIVTFFAHDKHNESGYCGRVFHLTMENGETRTIKGPWSSRPAVFNTEVINLGDLIVEVVINNVVNHMRVKDIEPYLPHNIDLWSVVSSGTEFEVHPVDTRNGVLDPLFRKVQNDRNTYYVLGAKLTHLAL